MKTGFLPSFLPQPLSRSILHDLAVDSVPAADRSKHELYSQI